MSHIEKFICNNGAPEAVITVFHGDTKLSGVSITIKNANTDQGFSVSLSDQMSLKLYRFLGSALFRTGERQ